MPTLALYAQAGLRVLKSRRTSRKRRKQRAAARSKPVVASSVLFRWLLRACVGWLAYEWMRVSAGRAEQQARQAALWLAAQCSL